MLAMANLLCSQGRKFSVRSLASIADANLGLSKTPLFDLHEAHKGKMVPYANSIMPLSYAKMTPKQSHLHTREHVSLFDVSHMLQTRIHGKDRVEFMESISVSDTSNLKERKGQLTVFTNYKGGIEDDLIVSNQGDHLYVVSNAGCKDKDLKIMQDRISAMKSTGKDVSLENLSLSHSLIAVQGPKMIELLAPGLIDSLENLPFMTSVSTSVYGFKDCLVTRCGYTGEDGVEISVPNRDAIGLTEKLLKKDYAELAGLAARDSLRIEAGLCLYEHEMNENTTPIEAGLGWLISKRRRASLGFPGDDVIADQIKNSPTMKRIGFTMTAATGPVPRIQHALCSMEGEPVGQVTSGCAGPSVEKTIGMGYIKNDKKFTSVGQPIQVMIRGKMYPAEVSKMPFVPARYFIRK